jgi:uncharacterized membrane protein YkoI
MRLLTKLLLPVALLCVSSTDAAADRFASKDGRHQSQQGRLVIGQNDGPSLNEAIEQVKRQYNGRIVSAETRMNGNREVHYIKVLTSDGKVKTVKIPGRSRRS